MLQAGTELPATAALPTASLWLPGKKADAGGTSARAQEIARRRDELYGMLKDLPESEYELSLTDLVEKATGGGGSGAPTGTKESSPASRSASGRQMEPAGKERKSSRTRRDGVSSFRSRSDGVLLNFYMPASLKRSSTAPRPGRPPGAAGGSARFSADCNKRERERQCEVLAVAVGSTLAEVEPEGFAGAARRADDPHHGFGCNPEGCRSLYCPF